MIFLTALSGVLFVIPVFVTFGIYFGIEHERILRCGLSGCKTSGNTTIDDPDTLTKTLFCEKSYAVSPPPGEYVCTSAQSRSCKAAPFHCVCRMRGGTEPQGLRSRVHRFRQLYRGTVNR